MIARKITYKGDFTPEIVGMIYDIARKIEITGEVKAPNNHEVTLNLEGDPSMIKLIQHKVEHKVKDSIKSKTIENLPYQYYVGLTYLP